MIVLIWLLAFLTEDFPPNIHKATMRMPRSLLSAGERASIWPGYMFLAHALLLTSVICQLTLWTNPSLCLHWFCSQPWGRTLGSGSDGTCDPKARIKRLQWLPLPTLPWTTADIQPEHPGEKRQVPVWAPVLGERALWVPLAVLVMQTLGVGHTLVDNPLSRGCCQNHDHLHSRERSWCCCVLSISFMWVCFIVILFLLQKSLSKITWWI